MSFDEWHDKAYGPPPFSDTIFTLQQRVQDAETSLALANMQYHAVYQWNAQRLAAKEAWDKAMQLVHVS